MQVCDTFHSMAILNVVLQTVSTLADPNNLYCLLIGIAEACSGQQDQKEAGNCPSGDT